MNSVIVASAGMAGLFILIGLGMPIGFAMMVTGFLGFCYAVGLEGALSILGQVPFHTISFHEYAAIPLFILMGLFAFHADISRDLFDCSYKWLGQLPGGLAISAVSGCAMFASICGSSMPTAATMGIIALPEMKKRGYDDALATGSLAAGGTLGVLIPPSLGMVVYGLLAEESIGRLFIAGILPGILMALLFFVTIWIQCRINPRRGPIGPRFTMSERVRSLKGILPTAGIFFMCMGGLYFGFFTPVETAAAGAAAALGYGLASRRLTLEKTLLAVRETADITLMIFAILIGASIFGYFITATEVPLSLSNAFATSTANKYVVLVGIVLMYTVIGCLMEFFSMMILTLPIILPTVKALGFDVIWYGVVMVIMLEVGQITPPIGINVFTIKGVAPEVPLERIFYGILPFWVAMMVCLLIITVFPEIATYLPSKMF